MAGCGRHKEASSVGERLFNEPVYDWGKSTGETLTVWVHIRIYDLYQEGI